METVFRWYIKLRITLNIDSFTISRELRTVYGDHAPSHLDIEKWIFNQHTTNIMNVSVEGSSTDVSALHDTQMKTEDSAFLSLYSFTSSFTSLFSDLYDTVLRLE